MINFRQRIQIQLYLQIQSQIYKHSSLIAINKLQQKQNMGNRFQRLSSSQQNELPSITTITKRQQCSNSIEQQKLSPDKHSRIGLVTCINGQGVLRVLGCATLISTNLVVTAASNIFRRSQQSIYCHPGFEEQRLHLTSFRRLLFHPNLYDKICKQNGNQIECWRYPQKFFGNQHRNATVSDYALLKLANKIENRQQISLVNVQLCSICVHQSYFKSYFEIISPAQMKSEAANNLLVSKFEEKANNISTINFYNKRLKIIFYQIKNSLYHNGSPLFFKNSLIGINIKNNEKQRQNFGKIFDKETLNQLSKWANEMNANQFVLTQQRICFHASSQVDEQKCTSNIKLGVEYNSKKQYKKAIQSFSKAIMYNKNNLIAIKNRGHAFFTLCEYNKAIADFQKVIQLKPDQIDGWFDLGRTYIKVDQNLKAVISLSKAIQLNPSKSSNYNERGTAYYYLKNYDQSIRDLIKAIQLDTNFYIYYINLGSALYQVKKFKEAIQNFQKSMQINPDIAETYFRRGLSYRKLSEYSKAFQNFNKAINIKSDVAQYYAGRAFLNIIVGKYQKAIQDYSQIIQVLKPKVNIAKYHFLRGLAYFFTKQYESCIRNCQKALQLNPNQVIIYCQQRQKTMIIEIDKITLKDQQFKIIQMLNIRKPLLYICIFGCLHNPQQKFQNSMFMSKCKQLFTLQTFIKIQSQYSLNTRSIKYLDQKLEIYGKYATQNEQ